MKVLSNKEFESVITWMPSGKSFSIVDSKAFVAEILPDHFKSAKYASFTRKLHRWGFMRHYRGEEAGAFYHHLFQKDRLDLVEQMTCHKEQLAAAASASPSVNKIPKVPEVALRPMPQQPQNNNNNNMPANITDEMMAKLRMQMSGLQPQVGSAAQRLNAAIELEVARRIQERIKAAAVSRQLALFQNQQAQSQPQQQHFLQAQLLQQQQHQQQQFAMMNKGLKVGLGDLLSSPMEGTMGLEQLPSVNVPSARTA